MLAQYMLSQCVHPSVHLSQAGTVPKWLNAESHKQCHTIAQEHLVFWNQKSRRNSQGDPNGGAK